MSQGHAVIGSLLTRRRKLANHTIHCKYEEGHAENTVTVYNMDAHSGHTKDENTQDKSNSSYCCYRLYLFLNNLEFLAIKENIYVLSQSPDIISIKNNFSNQRLSIFKQFHSVIMAEVFSWWRVITIVGRGLSVERGG